VLGPIANELITNAVKHAFRKKNEGRITVALPAYGEVMELAMANDDSGFRTTSSRGHGLELMRAGRSRWWCSGSPLKAGQFGGSHSAARTNRRSVPEFRNLRIEQPNRRRAESRIKKEPLP